MSAERTPEVIGTYSTFAAEIDATEVAGVDPGFDSENFIPFISSAHQDVFADAGYYTADLGIDATEVVSSPFSNMAESAIEILTAPFIDRGIHENAITPAALPQHTVNGPQTQISRAPNTVQASNTAQGLDQPLFADRHMSGQEDAETRANIGVEQINRDIAAQDQAMQKAEPAPNTAGSPTSPSHTTFSTVAAKTALDVGATLALGAINPALAAGYQMMTAPSTVLDIRQAVQTQISSVPSSPSAGGNSRVQAEQDARMLAARHEAERSAILSSSSRGGYIESGSDSGAGSTGGSAAASAATGSFAEQIAPTMDPNSNTTTPTLQLQSLHAFSQAVEMSQTYRGRRAEELEDNEVDRAAEEIDGVDSFEPDQTQRSQLMALA